MTEKVKKISKRAVKIAEILEDVLFAKVGLYTMSLTKEEIYILLTEHKLIMKDGDKIICQIEE
jgi:hypothetical protein